MPKTTKTQKGVAMDYLASPRSEGLVVSLLALLGFQAPEGGRLPAGVKYDTLKALRDVFSISEASEIVAMIGSRIAELQAGRKSASAGRITASPKSIVDAVKSGKLSLDELKEALASMD
jgi:uncharacterized small protein (DUF1192 family)|tara:strand:- start:291 stop:647 length:357 start_codon:yes stop_codon:yes gene_type:complete